MAEEEGGAAADQVFTVVKAAMLSPLAAIWQLIQHIQIIPANHWAGLPVVIYHITLTCKTSFTLYTRRLPRLQGGGWLWRCNTHSCPVDTESKVVKAGVHTDHRAWLTTSPLLVGGVEADTRGKESFEKLGITKALITMLM